MLEPSPRTSQTSAVEHNYLGLLEEREELKRHVVGLTQRNLKRELDNQDETKELQSLRDGVAALTQQVGLV